MKKSYEHDYGAGKEIFRLCKCIAARPLQQPVQQKAAGNDLANTASVCNPASLYKTGGKHSGGILPLRSACRNIKLGEPLPIDQFISFVLSNVLPFSKEA